MDQEPTQEDASSALEQFRQEWQEEVNARSRQHKQPEHKPPQPPKTRSESASKVERPVNKLGSRHPIIEVDEDDVGEDSPRSELIERIEGLRMKEVDEDDFSVDISNAEPRSALEHYERAVEKESQGNLGDSLSHYRRAYRLDAKVDQSYKMKHFSGKWKNSTTDPNKPSADASVIDSSNSEQPIVPASFEELIASYAGLPIIGVQPIFKGDKEPPCIIRKLPAEVLMELLFYVAIADPCVFTRLALVCKRLAYHVFSENSIWKRVALGPEFGLASQRYQFATDLQGREAISRTLEEDENSTESELTPVGEALFALGTDYREVFRTHPRVRFSGVYISTVNYTRAGGVSATPASWHSSVHIVTYYRYLRLFRDGTLISLLTTNEPIDVVHHLTKENMAFVRPIGKPSTSITQQPSSAKDAHTIPPAVQTLLKHALRGRWKLCHPSIDDPCSGVEIGANMGVAGDIHIETEGAAPRYTYTMHLSLKSSSRSKHTAKNNKLIWKGFWKHNHLTDDWAEFTLKNDKAFFFSRVRSYGLGY